jgi:hypothetical protein
MFPTPNKSFDSYLMKDNYKSQFYSTLVKDIQIQIIPLSDAGAFEKACYQIMLSGLCGSMKSVTIQSEIS